MLKVSPTKLGSANKSLAHSSGRASMRACPPTDRSIVHVDLAASVTNCDHDDDGEAGAGKTVFTIPLNILSLPLLLFIVGAVGQKIIILILHEGISSVYISSRPGLGLSIFCQRVSASPRSVSC